MPAVYPLVLVEKLPQAVVSVGPVEAAVGEVPEVVAVEVEDQQEVQLVLDQEAVPTLEDTKILLAAVAAVLVSRLFSKIRMNSTR